MAVNKFDVGHAYEITNKKEDWDSLFSLLPGGGLHRASRPTLYKEGRENQV